MQPIVSALVMAAIAAFVVTARADERNDRSSRGYTNADIKGGYGCDVSGPLSDADVVATAQFHPQGDGTFSASVFTLNIGGIGVCLYSLEPGTGTYDVNPNGVGLAQATYARQTGLAAGCPTEFPAHISFVCLPAPIEWLSDNGSSYTAHETRRLAREIRLVPRTTPIESPQSNGMAEAFVKTLKRDYARVNPRPDAASVLRHLDGWFQHYNTVHPHKALRYCSPSEFRRQLVERTTEEAVGAVRRPQPWTNRKNQTPSGYSGATPVHGAPEFQNTAAVRGGAVNFRGARAPGPIFPEQSARRLLDSTGERCTSTTNGRRDKSTAVGRGACVGLDFPVGYRPCFAAARCENPKKINCRSAVKPTKARQWPAV